MAESQESWFLVLLASPLDTIESIQEVTRSQKLPPRIKDEETIQYHFSSVEEGAAALLDMKEAAALNEWAERHRAVYKPRIAQLTCAQKQKAIQASWKLEYPCWFFFPQLETPEDRGSEAVLRERGFAPRPARITGFEYVPEAAQSTTQTRLQPTSTPKGRSHPKLRPAQDVLSRLRHDPTMDQADYQVIWEDRFTGEVTTDLALWKNDVSDEEFIPMHRIVRFQRKWDGVVVWDRNARIDYLFGDNAEPSVFGFAVEAPRAEDFAKLVEVSAPLIAPRPCLIEFTDQEGGAAKGQTFR